MHTVGSRRSTSVGPGLYTTEQAARLFGVRPHRLRYWAQSGFIVPSGCRDGRAAYTFRDLVALKVARALLDEGMPVRRVRACLDALRLKLPASDADLATTRIRVVEGHLVVDDENGAFDPRTGQGVLDFHLRGLEKEVAEVVALGTNGGAPGEEETAYAAFERGRALEAADLDAAIDAYRRAVEADPYFAAAWTNLGALWADCGDLDAARDCFERALEADPDQSEARMNLAALAMEQGDHEVAIFGYRQVLRTAPECYEAHYGLARALLAVGGRAQAAAHLRRFLKAAVEAGEASARVEAVRRLLSQMDARSGSPRS